MVAKSVKTVFIDRDGVINRNRDDHVKNWSEFEFITTAIQGLVELSQAGFQLIVVTNQSIINRGLVPAEVVENINQQMLGVVAKQGGSIAACLYCPHLPEERCGCRKPEPGLFFQARQKYGAKLRGDYLIGDHLNDIEAGQRAGCVSGLVLTGRGQKSWNTLPDDFRANLPVWTDLLEAARWIIKREVDHFLTVPSLSRPQLAKCSYTYSKSS